MAHKRNTLLSTETTFTWSTASGGDRSPPRQKFNGHVEDNAAESLDNILEKLNLENYNILTPEERQHCLENIDAVVMFEALQNLNKELANLKTENFVLKDFLQKNDPKLLIGLSERRETLRKSITSVLSGRLSNAPSHSISERSGGRSITPSITGMGLLERRRNEYRLTYRARSEMVEKLAVETERRILELEQREMANIKALNAQIEEMNLLYKEIQDTIENFKLHFLRDERDLRFLEYGTERQLEQSLRKFITNWIKNARALTSTMRLKSTNIQEQCQQLKNDLIIKSDLSGVLSSVDFEQLLIKRNQLAAALEEKNTDMAGLKGVTGKASMAMAREKQIMMSIETEMNVIRQRTKDVERIVSKLEREVEFVQATNKKDKEALRTLREQLAQYEAPSVNNYILKKEELATLEKEEKLINRKISILNLKLSSLMKRCKLNADNLDTNLK